MLIKRLLVVATILSLAASACDRQSLPTTPSVQPSPSAGPTPTPATHRVSGSVTHDGFFGLRGARVEVTVGAARDVTLTDADGRFVFDGMPGGDAEVTATKDGYEPSVQRVHVTRDVAIDFALKPFGYIDITGTYSLRITAASHCDLPKEALTRTYTALVRRNGGFQVTLNGAEDFLAGNDFFGWMDEKGLSFGTPYTDYVDYLPLLEPLAPSTALMIEFEVEPTVSPTRLVGTMRGALTIVPFVDGRFDLSHPVAICSSSSHQFLMSR